MIWTVPALLALGCVAAISLATHSRDADMRLLAYELAAVWLIANGLWLINHLQYLPILDWLLGVQAILIYTVRHEKWTALFVVLIALRLTFHVAHYLTAHAFLVLYIHGLNATFALLLVTVSHAGGCHARDIGLGYLHRIGAGLRNSLGATRPGLIP